MRVLVAARLSQLADGQTGLDSQDAEAQAWAQQNGHTVVDVIADRKSGTVQPWDRPNLKPWVTEPERIAEYDAVVAYRLDRLSRGDNESTNEIEAWAHKHGKHLLTVDGLTFPCEGVDGIRWDVTKRIAHDEWLKISERYRRMQNYLKGKGKVVGRPPFGYAVVPAKDGHKTIAPTEIGRVWVPQIFEKCINGASLGTIAEWLTACGVEPQQHALWSARPLDKRGPEPSLSWDAKSVGQIIRNSTYMGWRPQWIRTNVRIKDANGEDTEHREPPVWEPLPVEGVVDAATFKRAGEAIDKRPKRGPVNPDRRPMLGGGALFCPFCSGPMYAINRKQAGGYYRCAGSGPARRSKCRNMVAVPKVNAAVNAIASGATFNVPVMRRTIQRGTDHTAELEAIRFEMRHLPDRGLSWDEEDAERAKLRAEHDRLSSAPVTADVVVEEPTGQTYAELWEALSESERGPWLVRQGFRVEASRERVRLSQPDHPRKVAATVDL